MTPGIKIGDLIGKRYQIKEEIDGSGMSHVYRGIDTQTSQEVAIKILQERFVSHHLEDKIRFQKEASLVSRLEHPQIIKIYENGTHEGSHYLVMEFIKGETLQKYIDREREIPLDLAIDILIQVTNALDYVHENKIIHRDLKPGNILLEKDQKGGIGEQGFKIRIIDFGLAHLMYLTRIKVTEEVVGTFNYMSPEQSGIVRKPIDERSDLYSLGIIRYQLLSGELPFKGEDVATILHQHISRKPTPLLQIKKIIPPILGEITLKLLEKDQEKRYQTARGLLVDLKKYQQGKTAFPLGKSDRLGKLNYRTLLVGRDHELRNLQIIYDFAQHGRGGICLVSGEAGQGKSRFIEEFQAHVYELGGEFISGKCFAQEHKTPYQPFQEAINEYVSKVGQSSEAEKDKVRERLREGVGELGEIIYQFNPTMREILGEVPSLVPLDTPEKENRRFLIVCTRFFKSLGEKGRPVVLFIDDLHWADEGTLTLLNEIIGDIRPYPLLILGAYRDNEVGQTHRLTKIIQEARKYRIPLDEIQLKNLDTTEMNNFITDLLLEERNRVNELSAYIYKKSKGNPFFTIEILRQIVDEKGIRHNKYHWEIDKEKLGAISISVSIVEILLRRINSLGSDELEILSTAAVIGKRFKVDLLQAVTQLPMEKLIKLVDEVIELQLLEKGNERGELIFIHDRVRDAFSQRISKEEEKSLHLRIGQVLEEMAKDSNELDQVIFELANHYIEGGNEKKVLEYGIPAGKKAKANYANAEAIGFYLRAKLILEKQEKRAGPEYLEVLEDLGDVYRLAGDFLEAVRVLDGCKDLIPKEDKLRMAELYYKIGLTFWVAGKLEDSIYILERCLYSLGVEMPKGKFGLAVRTFRELLVQGLHTIFPGIFVRREYTDNPLQTVIVKLLITLSHIYYFMDIKRCFYIFLRMLNLAEKIGPSYELAYGYNVGGCIWITLPWFSRAKRDLAKGLEISRKIDNRLLEGVSYAYYSYAFYAKNDIKGAVDYGYKGIELLKNIGDYFGLGAAYAFYIDSNTLSGKFKIASQFADDFIILMKQVRSLQYLGWAYGCKYRSSCFTGNIDDEIIDEAKQSIELARQTNDKTSFIWSREVLAFAYLIRRDYKKAIEIIEEVVDLFPTHLNGGVWTLELFPIGAQIYTSVLINSPNLSDKERKRYLERARWFSKKAIGWGKKYRYFLGWAYQVNGTYNWLIGKKEKAEDIWETGIKWLREQTQDKYRLGYILLEEASFFLKDKPNDQETIARYKDYLVEARDLFAECGAELDLKRTNKLLMDIDPELVKEQEDEWTTQRKLERSVQRSSISNMEIAPASGDDLNKVLEKILDTAIEVGGAERGALLLYPEEIEKEKGLEVKVSRNFNKAPYGTEEFEISTSILKKVEESGQPIIVTDAEADMALKQNLSVHRHGLRSIMCVPIFIRNRMIGCIYLENRLISGLFTEDKLELVGFLTRKICDSIEAARTRFRD
ncbi:MAG: protein kinase [bacterium]